MRIHLLPLVADFLRSDLDMPVLLVYAVHRSDAPKRDWHKALVVERFGPDGTGGVSYV